MTTKFLDNIICTFRILLSWRFPRKLAFWTIFLSAAKAPPLKKRKCYFYCRLAVSERKKHPKKICIKNFGGTLAGGSRRGLRRPNSLCRCWFSQQNTVHKEFRGGGSKGVLGVGSKVQFWGPTAGMPQTLSFKPFEASRAFPELSPPQYGWGRLFFQNWFRRGPLRAGHGIPSSTEGISDY